MTPEQAGQALLTLQAAFPGFAEDDIAVGLWLTRLQNTDLHTARQAVTRLIDTRTRPPTIADYHDAVKAVTPPPPPAIEQTKHEPTEAGYQAIAAAKELAAKFSGQPHRQARRVERTPNL